MLTKQQEADDIGSALRSRRLVYRATLQGEALSESAFAAQFERAVQRGMARARISGKAGWLGKSVGEGVTAATSSHNAGKRYFKEFEVFLVLPEAVRPGRIRGWLNLPQHGWTVLEETRGRKQSGRKFFHLPLAVWGTAGSSGRVLGPGFAAKATTTEALAVREHTEATAAAASTPASGNGKVRRSADEDTIHVHVPGNAEEDKTEVQVPRTPTPAAAMEGADGGRVWTEEEIKTLVRKTVRETLAEAARGLDALLAQ